MCVCVGLMVYWGFDKDEEEMGILMCRYKCTIQCASCCQIYSWQIKLFCTY